ncbi:MAG: hypothetical protein V1793_00025 [Pseudomonadota bacterium]
MITAARRLLPLFLVLITAAGLRAQSLPDLWNSVEALNLSRHGYVLGSVLDDAAKAVALSHLVEAPWTGTYKFLDKGVAVVADSATDRILVIYELHEGAFRSDLQDMIGELFLAYGEPTVSAHDTLVYWAFGAEGKFSQTQFDKARDDIKPLLVLATVKLKSDLAIMNPAPPKEGEPAPTGTVYCIISSDPVLKHFKPGN